jgi:acetyl-CoA C-acetyltransferase
LRRVYITGIGQTSVREHWDRSARELAASTILEAMEQAGAQKADAIYVGNALSGELTGQENVAALVADFAGLTGTEAIRVEAAGASGGAAIRLGYLAVASGVQDTVVVTGVEKMSDLAGPAVDAALGTSTDEEYEAIHGLSVVALYAFLMRRYMHQFDVERRDFAQFSVNAHRNAANNPYAMFRRPITVEQFQQSRLVADPIGLLDSAGAGDGAATIILCSEEDAGGRANPAVEIIGSALATDAVALHDRSNPLFLRAVHDSAQKAYEQAGVGPEQIDIFELHDASAILSSLSLEASGFASEGEGVRLAMQGEIALEGSIPICTMGGLKARGYPVGAAGVYQVVELVQQLRGEAGANQVDARVGMAQSIGGTGATAVTHILKGPE